MKAEYPGLLPPGVHTYTLDELSKVVVDAIGTDRRALLFENLRQFIAEVDSTGVKAKYWIDGSFLTEKPEPNDIDLVVVVCPDSLKSLPADSEKLLRFLLNNEISKVRLSLDVYMVAYTDEPHCSYWRGWLGFHRDGETAKGIATIGACP